MSIINKGNVFANGGSQRSALENVRDTLRVDSDGSVSFKSHLGRGSGTPTNIPGDSFDEFVSLLQDVATRRSEIAAKELQREGTDSSETSDESNTETSETTGSSE